MKKFLVLIATLALVLSLSACGGEEKLPDEVDMDTIDMYLGRDNAQYIDLRNFDDKLNAGYIDGFTFVPYFDYLSAEGILTGKADFVIGDETRLKELFDKDAEAIFLMCQSGGRAGWVKAALESLGYENVYNITGWMNYDGDNAILGDGSYALDADVYGSYTPGVYVGADEAHGYFVTVTINAHGGIEAVNFDAVSGNETDGYLTKQVLGEDYGMRTAEDLTWAEMANKFGDIIVANQGWSADWKINVSTTGGHDYFDLAKVDDPETTEDETYAGDQVTIDAVAGVTAGIEGFKVAWEDAMSQFDAS